MPPSAWRRSRSNRSCCRFRRVALASELFAADVEIVGSGVSEGDIARVLAAGSRHSQRDGRAVLHSLPVGYSIDGTDGIRDPRGMLGGKFGVDMHVATTEIAAARNLMLAVERCHLNVEAMVASPYVAGLSVLADDEADLGAAVVDMGAGTTTMAVFAGGRFVHLDGFALGGQHVTMDHRPRLERPRRPMPSESRRFTAACLPADRTSAT